MRVLLAGQLVVEGGNGLADLKPVALSAAKICFCANWFEDVPTVCVCGLPNKSCCHHLHFFGGSLGLKFRFSCARKCRQYMSWPFGAQVWTTF